MPHYSFVMPDMAKALAQVTTEKSSFFDFNQSPAERLIKFLMVRGRQDTAERILFITKGYNDGTAESEKKYFIHSIIQTADDVFRLPNVQGSEDKVKEHCKKYLPDFYIGREYKNLVNQVCDSFGYERPQYKLFGEERHEKNSKIKKFDLTEEKDVLEQLELESNKRSSKRSISPYKYTQLQPVKLTERSDLSKQNTSVRKRSIKKILTFVSAVIGVGEGFAPAKFYLALLLAAGVAVPVSYGLAAVAFGAAFTVNALLFLVNSYKTTNNIFFKKRLWKDGRGKTLEKHLILRNIVAVCCAAFSAFVIAGLSFYFSGVGTAIALFISAMTFIGFFGVLSFGATTMWKLETLDRVIEHAKKLILEPWSKLTAKKSFKLKLGHLLTLIINVIALAITVLLGITVVAATAGMFFGALSGIPIVVNILGVTGLKVVIAAAELALGTFFISNVSTVIEVLRLAVLNAPHAIKNTLVNIGKFFKNLWYYDPTQATYENPIRSSYVTVGNILAGLLLTFAGINAVGFAVGYFGSAATAAAVMSVVSIGGVLTPFVGGVLFYRCTSTCSSGLSILFNWWQCICSIKNSVSSC